MRLPPFPGRSRPHLHPVDKNGLAEAQTVTVHEKRARDGKLVDERAVRAVEIHHRDHVVQDHRLGVVTRDVGVGDHHIAIVRAAEQQPAARHRYFGTRACPLLHDKLRHSASSPV